MIKFAELSIHQQELYCAIYSIIIIITLISVLMNLVGKLHKKLLIFDLLMFVSEFICLIFLYEGYTIKIHSSTEKMSVIGQIIYNLPVLVLWLFSLVLLISSILGIIYSHYWSKHHLGKTSIKEGIDKLPTGLCFYYDNGIPILTNTSMNEMCSIITGKSLINGKAFYDACCKGIAKDGNIYIKIGEEPIIKLKNGTIKSFKCSKIEDRVYELIAIDVSSQYALGVELKNKNEELKKMNARLVEYGKNIERIISDKEILIAKIRIHDKIGYLLLLLKKSLQTNSNDNEKKKLLQEWQKFTTLFASEQEHIHMLEQLVLYAKTLGINLDVSGDLPSEKYLQEVIFIAIMECMTNTYAHAKGDLLSITINESDDNYKVTCMNNGVIPIEPIKEGGGLSSLRNMVKRLNGTMKIEIKSKFILTIILSKKKV